MIVVDCFTPCGQFRVFTPATDWEGRKLFVQLFSCAKKDQLVKWLKDNPPPLEQWYIVANVNIMERKK